MSITVTGTGSSVEVEVVTGAGPGVEGPPGEGVPDIEEGDAGKALVVNEAEDGAEWGTVEGGGVELPIAQSDVTGLVAALAAKATPAQITAAIAALVDSAPGTLDTLNELAAALGDDPNLATTLTNLIATKATPAQIATAVSDHNLSGAAHADIRALIGAGGGGNVYYAGVAFENEPATSHALYATLPVDEVVALLGDVSSGMYTTDGTEDLVGPSDVVFADYDVVHAATGAGSIAEAFAGVTKSGAVYVRDPVLDGWHRLSSMNAGDVQVGDTFAGNLTLNPTDVLVTALTQIDELTLGGGAVQDVEAPSDGTTTTVDAFQGRTNIWVGRSAGVERAHVVIWDPAETPDAEVLVAGRASGGLGTARMGASVGWDTGAGAWPGSVPATGSGFAGSTVGIGDVDGDSDTNLTGGVTLEFDDDYGGGNGHKYLADTDLGPTDPLNSVVITNLAVNGAPADVIVGVTLADGGTPLAGEGVGWDNLADSEGDVTLTPDVPITDLDDIGVLIYVFTIGGAPVPPDSVSFDSLEWVTDVPVASVYEGFDGTTEGVGDLNVPHDGPNTHHTPDGPYSIHKAQLLVSDGVSWLSHAGPDRADRVVTAPLDFASGVYAGVGNVDQALKATETWINDSDAADVLGSWSNPHITEDATEPGGAVDDDYWVHPPA